MQQSDIDTLIANTQCPEFNKFCGHDERWIHQSRALTRYVADHLGEVGNQRLVVVPIDKDRLSRGADLLSPQRMLYKPWALYDNALRTSSSEDVEAMGVAMVQSIRGQLSKRAAEMSDPALYLVWAPLWLVARRQTDGQGFWCWRGSLRAQRAW